MEAVSYAMTQVLTFTGTIIDTITGQPLLCFLLGAGLVPVGISVFSSLKNAARS